MQLTECQLACCAQEHDLLSPCVILTRKLLTTAREMQFQPCKFANVRWDQVSGNSKLFNYVGNDEMPMRPLTNEAFAKRIPGPVISSINYSVQSNIHNVLTQTGVILKQESEQNSSNQTFGSRAPSSSLLHTFPLNALAKHGSLAFFRLRTYFFQLHGCNCWTIFGLQATHQQLIWV